MTILPPGMTVVDFISDLATTKDVRDLRDRIPSDEVRFSAPRQGVTATFETTTDLLKWLDQTSKRWTQFGRDANGAGLPRLAAHANNISRLVKESADGVLRHNYSLLKAYERLCQLEMLAPLGSTLTQYVFDDSFPISHRCFALVTFLKANATSEADLGDNAERLPLPTGALVEEFNSSYPDFVRSDGLAQVLYDMTARTLGRYLESAMRVDQQRVQFERYMAGAKLRAELGPAAERWRKKAVFHYLWALIGFLPFLAILVLPIWYWPNVSNFVKDLWYLEPAVQTHLTAWSHLLKEGSWSLLLFVTIPTFFVAWVLRHFSRLHIHSLNAAADAGNRSAMADVYARMIAEGGQFTHDQQTIIIQSLFAGKEGSPDHEGIPPNILEDAVKALKNKVGN